MQVLPPVIFAICMAIFVAKAVTSMAQESSTWDETHYFGLGKYILKSGRWDVPDALLHPPLSFYIQSLPLFFFPTDDELWKDDAAQLHNPQYSELPQNIARGQALLSMPANQGNRLLNLSRFMMVLTAVLLAWFVYAWSYSLYGKWSAICAVVLYSFCPNILAHARLITPDIAVTAFSFMTMYYFARVLREKRTLPGIAGGICLGLALLSKATALLMIPIAAVLAGLWWLKNRNLPVLPCCIFAATGFAVLWAGFGFNLQPFFSGIALQREAVDTLHWGFLAGDYSETGWWYYYTAAFFIKTPVAALIVLLISSVLFFRNSARRIDEAFLLVPAAAVLIFFAIYHSTVGLRYVLPIYPFLFVFASKAAPLLISTKIRTGFLIALTAWYVGASCYIHPHYLAYFNELVGGPNNGYKYLVDSNLDWGQDLIGLKRFMDEHAIPKISLSYFGTDAPGRYGISYDWLPSVVLQNPIPERPATMPKGWVAISATNLQGSYFKNYHAYAAFKEREPMAKIGYSILIYKVD